MSTGLAITPDISPGKRQAEGTIRAKGQVMSWSLLTEASLTLSAIKESRTYLSSEQEGQTFKVGEEEYEHLLIDLKALGL